MKHLKLLLKTLINNNACVEAARTKEIKYNIFAPVFAILALFLAVLPSAVSGFTQQGSAWLNGNTYGIEVGLQEFGNAAASKSVSITLGSDKTVTISGMDNLDPFQAYDLEEQPDGTIITSATPRTVVTNEHRFIYSNSLYPGKIVDVLEVYAFNDSGESLKKKVSNILDNLVPDCPDDKHDDSNYFLKKLTDKDGKVTKVGRTTSVIIFGKDCYYAVMMNPTSTSVVASTYGDYHHMEYGEIISELTASQNNIMETLDNWKKFSDLGVIDTRTASTWKTIGIMCGVNGGVMLFMGFMVWVLTRGKNNPFRIYTIWDSFKISFYASLAPAILGLLGFIMPSFSIMMFVLFVGVRVMWLSMRTLRYQAPAKN